MKLSNVKISPRVIS